MKKTWIAFKLKSNTLIGVFDGHESAQDAADYIFRYGGPLYDKPDGEQITVFEVISKSKTFRPTTVTVAEEVLP